MGIWPHLSRLSSALRPGENRMVKTYLRRLLAKLHRPDQMAGDQHARPAPIDPATIEAREGNVDELAGLPPSDCVDRSKAEGQR